MRAIYPFYIFEGIQERRDIPSHISLGHGAASVNVVKGRAGQARGAWDMHGVPSRLGAYWSITFICTFCCWKFVLDTPLEASGVHKGAFFKLLHNIIVTEDSYIPLLGSGIHYFG